MKKRSARPQENPSSVRVALLTAPGIAKWTLRELDHRGIALEEPTIARLKNHELIRGDVSKHAVEEVLHSRTTEEVFIVLAEEVPVASKIELRRLYKLDLKKKVLESLKWKGAKRSTKKVTDFWVFIKQDRDYEIYRRDIAEILVENLRLNFRHWRAQEPADVELWGFIIAGRLTLGLRLTGAEHRKRRYRTSERPGTLRPPIAAALVLMSSPHPQDRVLDPMCGTGTLMIERLQWGEAAQVIGGDSDRAAVEIARANLLAAGVPGEVHRWDATNKEEIATRVGKVDRIICNLPFGKRFKSADLVKLYTDALKAWRPLLTRDATVVLLTSEQSALTRAAASARFRVQALGRIEVQGIRAGAYRLRLGR